MLNPGTVTTSDGKEYKVVEDLNHPSMIITDMETNTMIVGEEKVRVEEVSSLSDQNMSKRYQAYFNARNNELRATYKRQAKARAASQAARKARRKNRR